MNEKIIGKFVKEKRIFQGLNQKELASLIGVAPSEICKIENGYRRKFGLQTFIKLKNVLKFTDEEIKNVFGVDAYNSYFSTNISSSNGLDNVFTSSEIAKILSLNRIDLIKLKDYINFLTDKNNIEQKEAISILVKSLYKSNNK